MKRISLLLKESQHLQLTEKGLNVSGLVRDLLDDYLSDHKVTISVSEDTRLLYEKIVSNTGSQDEEIEVYFRQSLQALLADKIKEMENLREQAFGRS